MKNDEELPCVRIAVSLPVKGTFSYAVPKRLAAKANVGYRVLAPFKNRNVTGYILEKIPRDHDETLKKISEILDPEPLFHKQAVPLFEWMARYYVYPIGRVIESALPGGLNIKPYKTALLTEKGLKALSTLPPDSEERKLLLWLKDHAGKRLPHPLKVFNALNKKGWITVQDRLSKPQAGPLMRKFVRPKEGMDLQAYLSESRASSKTTNEVEFLTKVFSPGPLLLSDLKGAFTNGSYLALKWIKKGVLESYLGPVYRNPAGNIIFPSPEPVELFEQQRRALLHIRACLDKKVFSSCLLHGVSGSGKTEVYYRAVKQVFRLGRQAILMVPEISLAIYMESVFRSRLGEKVAIYHSGLSQGERYDQWMRMVRGEVGLVIGARSALFAPLPRLGLIVVDEEHDSAYKQESNFRYQARDTAVLRGKMEKALVILGSGTPSVQSFHNTITGRYHLLSMPERVEARPMPDVEIVDMKPMEDEQSENPILSPKLIDALGKNLTAGNQTILFLNRRGFHRLFLCRSCGQAVRCPNCDVTLTYHLKEDQLSCHYCGFYSGTRVKCPSCGREGLRSYGFGTEKLEHELRELFPNARIGRMDKDSTRRKGEAIRILKRFSDHETDMLVGTQMITKGYDFPEVTLVGVIAADLSLGFPDFRAGERTFQLLSQVAGRSGRGSRRGRVIIQTFNPEHYAIRTATAHDYPAFFEEEMELRGQLSYPPFSHLACLRLKGNNREKTAEAVHRFSLSVRGILTQWPKRGKEIQVLGPAEAPISKLKGKHRWQILIKSKSVSLLQHFLTEVERRYKKGLQSNGVNLVLDVDPYQML
ncbi:MAG: primosomal protein N' [Deltaproteobacteria bacterium]|nr:primosomal protein N' [Deltaproteobacteria bacterium]